MKTLFITVLIFSAVLVFANTNPENPFGLTPGRVELRSASALTFSPTGILFIGDPKGAAIFAIDLKDNAKDTTSTPVEVKNIDKVLASYLGIAHEDILINDLVVNPNSQNIYLSVSRGRSSDAKPVLMCINRKGEAKEILLDDVLFSKTDIKNAPNETDKTSWGAPKRQMAVTDLQFSDNELYVAGLSNEEFSSHLRRLSFPFKDTHQNTSVEVFHTSHNRFETNSPIETLLPVTLNNQASILAGYGCAPLAKFSVAELKSNKHVQGFTLAELGGGSRPLDMILFKRKGEDHVLIANSNRSVYKMKVSDLEKSEPLTKPVDDIYVSSGTPFVATGFVGVLQIDNLNKNYVAAIQRDLQTGALHLVSINKKWL